MKTLYQCETCREKYETAEAALACEAALRPAKELEPPVGLLFGSTCGPGPRCKSARKGKDECDHLCSRGFIYLVQCVKPMQMDPHRSEVKLGIFRNPLVCKTTDSDTYELGEKAERGYDNWSGGTYFPFGVSKYDEERGFARWESWPEAGDCEALDRAVKACRAAGVKPYLLRGGKAIPAD